ncbi:Fatty acyl-CoA reductase 1 [Sarcoptes scabiei]|nr:Fatty acyl-CoA reductase 1 [Sarcoptes scabiei]
MMPIQQQQQLQLHQSIPEFYSGKSIFVTGASGFIGKVLIEKLLSACPNVDRIYLLIRPTRDGKPPSYRLEEEILKSKVFRLRNQTLNFTKLIAIAGDMTKPKLGLSDEDYRLLTETVSIVFHSAATVRFHGPLKKFIQQNVLGTKSVMELCRQMKHLKAVVYVSTAYANCNLIDVQERIYPVVDDIEGLIEKILKENSEMTPMPGHPSLMGRPNSYTISKAIAECLVDQKYRDLPVVICRPSIVTHAFNEPADGWCDSFNGVAGTLLLGGLVDCDYKADIIPVDYVANSLIVIGYHKGHQQKQTNTPTEIIHITSGTKNPITWGQILDFARVSAIKNPSTKMIRPIANNPISSKNFYGKMNYLFTKFFSHILFAYIFDFVLFLIGKKRIMVDVTNKMHRAFEVLDHFTNHQWEFRNEKYLKIFNQLERGDQNLFASNVETIDWFSYCDSLYIGTRRYLLNEDDSTIEDGKRRQNLLTIIYGILNFIIYSTLALPLLYAFWNVIFPQHSA